MFISFESETQYSWLFAWTIQTTKKPDDTDYMSFKTWLASDI